MALSENILFVFLFFRLATVGSDDPVGLRAAPQVSMDGNFWHRDNPMASVESTQLSKWCRIAGKTRFYNFHSIGEAVQLLLGLVHGWVLGHTLDRTEDWLRQVPGRILVEVGPVHNWAGVRNMDRLGWWGQVELPN